MDFEGVHDAVWPGDDEQLTGRCELCGDQFDFAELDAHFSTNHPAEWSEVARWPDGEVVVFNDDISPEDFA